MDFIVHPEISNATGLMPGCLTSMPTTWWLVAGRTARIALIEA